MLAQRDAIDAAYGRELSFESLEKTARVAEDGPEADVSTTNRYDEFIDWLIETGGPLGDARSLPSAPPSPDRA